MCWEINPKFWFVILQLKFEIRSVLGFFIEGVSVYVLQARSVLVVIHDDFEIVDWYDDCKF